MPLAGTPKGVNLPLQVNLHLQFGEEVMIEEGSINAGEGHHLLPIHLPHLDLPMQQEVKRNEIHVALADGVCVRNVLGVERKSSKKEERTSLFSHMMAPMAKQISY